MAGWRGFFGELKRRNVLRAGAFYAAAVWALSQGISQLSPAFGLPNGVTRWFVIACVIGFPFWIAFAWFYELTPQGIKRESEVERSASITRQTGRKLDYWIIGALALAVVLLLTNELVLQRSKTLREFAAAPAAEVNFDPPPDSIVVLPFANLSGDPGQRYFSDGITEELTDAIGQNAELRVIAWDTASTFRDPDQTATAVGRQLDVANLLHGSILRQGDQVRITVELVNTVTGYQLWSAHYDDSLKNIFAVQDKISAAIAAALNVKFAAMRVAPNVDPEAYELVLKARALMARRERTQYAVAQHDIEKAIELDPDYADAYAALADALLNQTDYSTLSFQDTAPRARALAQKALVLDPANVNALRILATEDLNELKHAQAQDEFRKALAIDPNDAHTLVDYALTLPVKAGLAEVREAVLLDPHSVVAQLNLALLYAYLRDYARMLAPAQAALQINPGSPDGEFLLAFAYQRLHQNEAMLKAFELVKPASPLDKLQVQAGRLTYQSLSDPALRPQAIEAVERLRQAKPGPYAQRHLIQLYLALGEKQAALRQLETLCPSFAIACSDLSLFPMFQPLAGDPRFQELAKRYASR